MGDQHGNLTENSIYSFGYLMQNVYKEPVISKCTYKIHSCNDEQTQKIVKLCETYESLPKMAGRPDCATCSVSSCPCTGCSKWAVANIYDIALSLSYSPG